MQSSRGADLPPRARCYRPGPGGRQLHRRQLALFPLSEDGHLAAASSILTEQGRGSQPRTPGRAARARRGLRCGGPAFRLRSIWTLHQLFVYRFDSSGWASFSTLPAIRPPRAGAARRRPAPLPRFTPTAATGTASTSWIARSRRSSGTPPPESSRPMPPCRPSRAGFTWWRTRRPKSG